ncbi:CiaD-like domain-containing protein [Campylobacter canadensis]|uniref:Campylobacter invasion antigen D C-terminal domain-containing protein n=1 Tax=Campylobacter canadensis TaxID=449520 RepID=A0ABS7WSJ3_9BACT|nr:hypothetical protein [Campylobacter canadensis]MBZ7987738.1 hypothetical protein [Campylobacter canadensis]MBZ7999061.1 hypothetical protein [Campylobacter canadensis]
MNIDDISKLALKMVQEEELKEERLKEERIKEERLEESNNFLMQGQKDFIEEKKEEFQDKSTTQSVLKTVDKLYLNKIKERILVLFEALKNADNENDLNKRLDLTIEFIQFLLAHIDEQLDKE